MKHKIKDLTGVHQRDILHTTAGLDGAISDFKPDVRLRALRVIRTDPKLGRIWEAACDCGRGTRELSAYNFTSGRIQKCEMCVDPERVTSQALLNARREALRNQWFRAEFKKSWRDQRSAFTSLQWILYEAILDRRKRRCPIEMQAVDIVLRTGMDELDIEIGSFGERRIADAIERVKLMSGVELSESESDVRTFLFR